MLNYCEEIFFIVFFLFVLSMKTSVAFYFHLKDDQLQGDVQRLQQLGRLCRLRRGEDVWSPRYSWRHPMERWLAGSWRHLWGVQWGKPLQHHKLDRCFPLDLRGIFYFTAVDVCPITVELKLVWNQMTVPVMGNCHTLNYTTPVSGLLLL